MRNIFTTLNEQTGKMNFYTSNDENVEDFFQFVSEDLKPSKIELVECLQQLTGKWHRFSSRIPLEAYSELSLLDSPKIKNMDLIHAKHRNGGGQIWLGYWNDGVMG